MQPTTPTPRLRLSSNVRVCNIDGQVIVLDLRRNQYFGLGNASLAISAHVDGWPRDSQGASPALTPAAITNLAQRLLARGVLTEGPALQAHPVDLENATASLHDASVSGTPAIGVARAARFLRSAATATLWLHCCSLESIASAVDARRTRSRNLPRSPGDLDAMLDGAAAYERLRPLLLSTQDRCLHDSLALVSFLAFEGQHPRWVIGVKAHPFGAHSWVQHGATVLNDQHERVRKYRPILVV